MVIVNNSELFVYLKGYIIVIANNDRKTAPKKVEFVHGPLQISSRDRPFTVTLKVAASSTIQRSAKNGGLSKGKIIEAAMLDLPASHVFHDAE